MRYLSAPVFILVLFLFATHPVQAHTLEADGTIQGVMHISPSHKPTATEPAHFEFFMANTSGKYNSAAYSYSLTITGNGMATATVPVQANGSTLNADYTFAQPGENYTASLSGSSTVASAPSFTLEFDDVFVFPQGQHESAIENLLDQHAAHVVLAILIILAFAGIVGYDHFVVRKSVV